MICPKCNKEIEDNSKFCLFCGEATEAATTVEIALTKEETKTVAQAKTTNQAKDDNSIFKGVSIVSFLISVVFVIIGFCKMLVYNSGEYYPYEARNAYVGGDAYNFIINGNYATAFFVLAVLFTIVGFGLLAVYYIKTNECKNQKCVIEKSEGTGEDNNGSVQ